MGSFWVMALLAIFVLPAALLDTGDAAIQMERTRRHEWR